MLFPASKAPGSHFPCRVVVTGAGIITALGAGWKANADGFRSGRQAIGPVTLFNVERQKSKIAAEIYLTEESPLPAISTQDWKKLNRAARLLVTAAVEAWQQAGWVPAGHEHVILGTTSGEMALGQDYLFQALHQPHRVKGQARRVAYYLVQQQGATLSKALGIEASLATISNACSSGANAIGHAWEMIRNGHAKRVLTGGYDALCHLTFAGFDTLQVLSPTPCRPFQSSRNGLTLGEGASVLALETLESAQARGAEILGEIAGYGASTDIHHLTQPHPDGAAALAAMKAACAAAGVTAENVDYINAHGTATPQNDAAEAAAINAWAGGRAKSLPVSSTKTAVGHLLGAAGAVEATVCLMALREQWLPPQHSPTPIDPVCQFEIVQNPRDARVNVALSNSFGFGGANATLIFRRWM